MYTEDMSNKQKQGEIDIPKPIMVIGSQGSGKTTWLRSFVSINRWMSTKQIHCLTYSEIIKMIKCELYVIHIIDGISKQTEIERLYDIWIDEKRKFVFATNINIENIPKYIIDAFDIVDIDALNKKN